MFQRVGDLGNRNSQIQSMVSEGQGGSTIPGGIKNQTGKSRKTCFDIRYFSVSHHPIIIILLLLTPFQVTCVSQSNQGVYENLKILE